MLVLCRCSECRLLTTIDADTGQEIPGFYVSRATFTSHRTQDTLNRPSKPKSHPSTNHQESSYALPPEAEKSLSSIRQNLEVFRSSRSVFLRDVTPVVFAPDLSSPLPLTAPQPPLALNKQFLSHREAVNRLGNSLDAIPSYNIPQVRGSRKAAVDEILRHMDYLDGLVLTAWASALEKGALAQSSLRTIAEAFEDFRKETSRFKNGLPSIRFPDLCNPLPLEPPPLLSAQNKVFVGHRERVSKILDTLDSVESHGIEAVRDQRRRSVDQILAYLAELEAWVTQQWKTFVAGRGRSETECLLTGIEDLLSDFRGRVLRFQSDKLVIRFLSSYPEPLSQQPPTLPVSLNESFLLHRKAVSEIIRNLTSISSINPTIEQQQKASLEEVTAHLATLDRSIADAWMVYTKEWNEEKAKDLHPDGGYIISCERFSSSSAKLATMSAGILVSLLTPIVLHLLSGLSRDSSNFLLLALRIIVSATCTTYVKQCFSDAGVDMMPQNDPISQLMGNKRWCVDIRTAIKEFDLEPDLVHYACCKICYSCYNKEKGQYPPTCTFRETPTSQMCGGALTEPGSNKPLQTFVYQPINSFLARLASRPGIIEQMKAVTSKWKLKPSSVRDFFGAGALRNLSGPDCKVFLDGPPEELRLVFSIFVDWFNPYGNKAAGKRASIGAIYLVCLNLPVHLRYRVENIYVAGLIPGEPETHHINHLLHPLVSDLLVLWKSGNWFSRTALHQAGCRIRAALLLLIADAPAARKVAGFVGIKANDPCHFCTQTKEEFANFDVASWTSRKLDSHLAMALNWKNAVSEADRLRDWKRHHIRWSELLRLPYWDPTRAVVVDPMHTLFLNAVDHHVRDNWKVDENETHGRKGLKAHTKAEQEDNLQACYSAIIHHNLCALQKLRRTYLEVFAKENQIGLSSDDKSSVPKLAKALIAWWSKQPQGAVLKIPQPSPEPSKDLLKSANPEHILDKNVVDEIRNDMNKIILPGWVNRAPRKFGSTSHGKVSADHWRTLCTINFVITLVRLWGHPQAKQFRHDHLSNFMALVAVVRFATARTISEAHIQIVEAQLQEYFRSLVKLRHTLYPSHHMLFHLPECLRLFGPVHDKLFSLPILKSFRDAFRQAFGQKDFRGSLVNDLLSAEVEHASAEPECWSKEREVTTLDNATYEGLCRYLNERSKTKFTTFSSVDAILLSPMVQEHAMIHDKGVVFATGKRSKGNSLVIFQPSQNSTALGALQGTLPYQGKKGVMDPSTRSSLWSENFFP
ncbi:hypothetical protein NLJ89_g8347 [Agrocybe chaxingu]|uniref:DUF4218 domain-containing protein n=1 Tax=Agrocybe chaxingu TaxID=84603 RepID=A0A9W8K2M4_9AGAR|nr:hypothetical protein NLJ89_g8347 [Agrocybe chaxingu]